MKPIFFAVPLTVFFAAQLGACAVTPVVHSYSWGRIIRAGQYDIDRVCLRARVTWDDGSKYFKGQHAVGCWDPVNHDLYIVNNCLGAQALPHELAHADGRSNPDGDGYGW